MVQKGGFAKYPAGGSDLTPDNEFTATELQWLSLHQGLSQPKFFTHRQWPLLKRNKTYRQQSPKKRYYVYYIYIYDMHMLKCKWDDLVQNRDSLLPGMIFPFILKKKKKKNHFSD